MVLSPAKLRDGDVGLRSHQCLHGRQSDDSDGGGTELPAGKSDIRHRWTVGSLGRNGSDRAFGDDSSRLADASASSSTASVTYVVVIRFKSL